MNRLFLISIAVLGWTVVHGQITFQKTYGGTASDWGSLVVQTSDGGYALCGSTSSFGAGSSDIYVIKMDSSSNLQWSKTIGGTNGDVGFSIIQSTDGGYVITGYTLSFGAGSYDAYILKLDGSGNLQWSKTVGGIDNDVGASIIQASDGSYVIGGWSWTDVPGHYEFYVMKLDVGGNLQWTKAIGAGNDEYGYSIIQASDGGYVITGYRDFFTPMFILLN